MLLLLSPFCPRVFTGSFIFLIAAILVGPRQVASENFTFSLDDVEETVEAIVNIIGGDIAAPGSTPWLVSLKDVRYPRPVHFCGGSILNSFWVITAARCIVGYEDPSHEVEVVVGEYNLDESDFLWEKKKEIQEVFVHPLYDFFTRDYNVALIQVAPEIIFNKRVSPIPLPPRRKNNHLLNFKMTPSDAKAAKEYGKWEVDGTTNTDVQSSDSVGIRDPCNVSKDARPVPYANKGLGYIAGWGSTEDTPDAINLVHGAFVPFVRKDICYSIYPGIFTMAMMCAGNLTSGGVDPCNGDWGGPLVDSNGYLSGVSSWSIGCGRPGYPAVYVDIHAVQEWICDVIEGGSDRYPLPPPLSSSSSSSSEEGRG